MINPANNSTAPRPLRTEQETYRCPGCGKDVNARSLADVREHHEHVLHPHLRHDWSRNTPAQSETPHGRN
jgi:hypothetical protein